MRRTWVTILAAVFAVGGLHGADAHEPGEVLFHLTDPLLEESSGVAVGSLPDGYLWTHEDSGGGLVFMAIGPSGDTAQRYGLTFGPRRAPDIEDMAAGPAPDGGTFLYLADIGDNARSRPFVTVYVVAEPDVVGGQTGDVTVVATHHLAYPDGPHDAEGFVVDPVTGAMAIITKEASGASGLYVVDKAPVIDAAGATLSVMRRVQTIDLGDLASPHEPWHFDATSRLLVTGAAISPSGTRLVLRTYVEAFEFSLGVGGVGGGLLGEAHRVDLPPTQQGEAIGYGWDGESLVVTSEGQFAPVHLVATNQ
ncbi:MAG: hypothetical protein ACT452_15690 [Microthrixaceae bacterium]